MKLEISKAIYEQNKFLVIGENCICPSCGSNFIKKSYQQIFCKNTDLRCKTKYWDMVQPDGHKKIVKILKENPIEQLLNITDYERYLLDSGEIKRKLNL